MIRTTSQPTIETLLSDVRTRLADLQTKKEDSLSAAIVKIERILDEMKPTVIQLSCAQREVRSLKTQLHLMEKEARSLKGQLRLAETRAAFAQAVSSNLAKELKLTQDQNSILREFVNVLSRSKICYTPEETKSVSPLASPPSGISSISVGSSPTLSEPALFRPIVPIPSPSPSPRSQTAPVTIHSPEPSPRRPLRRKEG